MTYRNWDEVNRERVKGKILFNLCSSFLETKGSIMIHGDGSLEKKSCDQQGK